MAEIKLAKRYAKSLLGLAMERSVQDRVFEDMSLIADACRSSRELSLFFKNPIINTDKKDSVIKSLFGNNVSEISIAFLQIITQKRRESYVQEIAEEFIRLYKELKGIASAKIITPISLGENLRNEFLEFLKKKTNKKVELEEVVDKDLIGGYILRWGDEQVDASISKKLRELRQDFKTNLYIKDF